jgi:TonB family protein
MSRTAISAEWVGRVIDGRFALLEWLGGSGSNGVFRTERPQPVTKKAAIKLIAAEGGEADAYLSGWAKSANLSHPHLMRVFRSGRFQFGSTGLVYVVTECADEVLEEIIPERALTPEETRQMLDPVIDALGYLHGKGFVHGHVKPSNILVVDDVLKLSGDSVAATGGVRVLFKEPSIYDAPETMRGAIAPSADVWALGVTLVEVMTQRLPVRDGAANREAVVPEEMPRVFAEIARDCLRHDPDQRATLSEIKARLAPSRPIEFPAGRMEKAEEPEAAAPDLVAVEEQRVDEAVDARGAAPAPVPGKMRWWLLVVGLLVVVVATVVWMMRRPSERRAVTETAQSRTQSAAGTEPGAGISTETGLTERGEVAQRVMPEVDSKARRSIHGVILVSIRVTVDANGQETTAELKSAGQSKYFARAAMEAARKWKFKAPVKNGQPVSSAWLIRFKFRQSGTEASAVEETPK